MGDGYRILIVEDESIVALELEDRLRRQGYEIVGSAGSAAEALAIYEQGPVDLALLDIRLTGPRDGVDLAADLQARGTPVVFLTAHDDDETLARVKSVEAQGYLLKPFDSRLLRLTIETTLHRHMAERARARAERAQRDAEQLQSAILEHAPDGVLLFAPDGGVVLANHAAQRMFGLSAEPSATGTLAQLLPDHAYDELRHACIGRAARRTEAQHRTGGRFPVDLVVGLAPLGDGDRGGERLVVIVRDISQQLQLEQQLSRARQLEVAGRVASGLAHDLNNLLSVVWMSGYLLRNATADALPSLLGDLQKAVDLGATLTTRLLSITRRAGVPRELPVNEALQTITKMVRRVIGSNVRLACELDPRAGTIIIDPAQFDQLLLNLALNGDRAMPKGGCLTIRSARREIDGQAAAVIEVEDTGVGMNPRTQRRLFEPFFTTRGSSGGTGLGLTVVKDAVESAGGTIEFESALGRGTRFCVTFPRHGDCECDCGDESSQLAADIGIAGCGVIVLLVDDDELHRSSLARLFQAHGFRPIQAGGSGEALLLVERTHEVIGLAVVDMQMPYMNGLELGERLKQTRRGLPVLLISGSERATPLVTTAVDGTLPKPVQPEQLFAEVSRLLSGPAEVE